MKTREIIEEIRRINNLNRGENLTDFEKILQLSEYRSVTVNAARRLNNHLIEIQRYSDLNVRLKKEIQNKINEEEHYKTEIFRLGTIQNDFMRMVDKYSDFFTKDDNFTVIGTIESGIKKFKQIQKENKELKTQIKQVESNYENCLQSQGGLRFENWDGSEEQLSRVLVFAGDWMATLTMDFEAYERLMNMDYENLNKEHVVGTVLKDGDSFVCVGPDFEDLQESDCYAYGDTPQEALEKFLEESND